jgi:hypothetical protein
VEYFKTLIEEDLAKTRIMIPNLRGENSAWHLPNVQR